MNVLFVSPAKTAYVAGDEVVDPPRDNVCVPALTVLGALKDKGIGADFMDLSSDGHDNATRLNENRYRFGLPDDAVVDKIRETKPDSVLITSMFSTDQQLVDNLTSIVKKACPNLPIIVGGIHASIKPNWILESGNVDFVVAGESEDSLPALLKEIEALGTKEVQNKRGRIAYNNRLADLDRPWAFEDVLLREGKYRYSDNVLRRSELYAPKNADTSLNSFMLYYSRGCPMHCDFCTTSERDGTRIRHIGSERMIKDFQLLHERYGVGVFYNEADAFGSHPEDIEFFKLLRGYRKEHPDFVINNPNGFFTSMFFPKSNDYQLDEGLLGLLADSGFNVVTFSIETFNPGYIGKIDDRITPEKIRELTKCIDKRKMKSELYMMYAFPGETSEELARDERLAERCGATLTTWHRCTILPGTAYYRRGLQEGWFTESEYRERLKGGYDFYLFTDDFNFCKMPASELRAFWEMHKNCVNL